MEGRRLGTRDVIGLIICVAIGFILGYAMAFGHGFSECIDVGLRYLETRNMTVPGIDHAIQRGLIG